MKNWFNIIGGPIQSINICIDFGNFFAFGSLLYYAFSYLPTIPEVAGLLFIICVGRVSLGPLLIGRTVNSKPLMH